ncbi:hypothetical protein EMN47_03050 [Prolixibacteraceae bacterium JC049]|nr:hypothetical protein [Prolixibacteraceae bacterium JC049]
MNKIVLLVLAVCVSTQLATAQVKGPKRIVGKYTGKEKKGVAHGKGKAEGKDTYEGNFKKGYPQGEGTYVFGDEFELKGLTFSKGDKYKGVFKKGMFDGKGKVIFADLNKGTKEGYWSKSKYMGRTRDGYEVIKLENAVRAVVLNNGVAQNKITVTGLKSISEVGKPSSEWNGVNCYMDIPENRFPITVHLKGSVPSTGELVEIELLIERPGDWSVRIETN